MAEPTPISDLFNIRRRFLRSAHIERDFGDGACLDGYVATPHVRDNLQRINAGLKRGSGLRSWRVTGDYGSGKSSFALLLAQLYSRREAEIQPKLRNALADVIRIIRNADVHFQPILVTGKREPLSIALMRGLGRSFEQASPGKRRTSTTAHLGYGGIQQRRRLV